MTTVIIILTTVFVLLVAIILKGMRAIAKDAQDEFTDDWWWNE